MKLEQLRAEDFLEELPRLWPSTAEGAEYTFEQQTIDFRRTFLETEHGRRVLSQIGYMAHSKPLGEDNLEGASLKLIHRQGREWLFGWINAVLSGRKVVDVKHETKPE